MTQKLILRSKCVILGNVGVGKTAVTQVFTSDGTQYPKNYSMTLHADISSKPVSVRDATVESTLVDVGGHDVFHELCPKLCENLATYIIVFDVTNVESFKSVKRWADIAKQAQSSKYRSSKTITGVLLGNKTDLNTRRAISPQQGQEIAKVLGLAYYECSAQSNSNIEKPFHFLANAVYEVHDEQSKQSN